MEKYRVYVGAIQNLTQKTKYSFCDPTRARMLVFATRKPDGDFRIMTQKEQETLSERESVWLSQTRLAVALNNTSQTATEFAQSMNKLMDALEEELKREKEGLENGGREKEPTGTE